MTGLSNSVLRWRNDISGQTLFVFALGLSLLLTMLLTVFIWSAAQRSDVQFASTIEARLLAILEESGISGLASTLDSAQRFVVPDTDRVEVALWQLRGETPNLVLETEAGAARAFEAQSSKVALNGVSMAVSQVDVVQASDDWSLPMKDIALSFGIAQPTTETRRATRLTQAIWIVWVGLTGLMVLLQITHWQRYQKSLLYINDVLSRYSDGETGIRLEQNIPAPELRELGRHLNVVLPRIDRLFSDLRALNAHLAHELKTPLQTIRIGIGKIVREPERTARTELASTVNRDIDSADARLQTVMQLFRLQADSEVTMVGGVAIGEILTNWIYDFEDALSAGNRNLSFEIDESVRVMGNAHLIDLMVANLLTNAEKYTPDDGRIRANLEAQAGLFSMRIENTGTLSEELADTAFDRFSQGTAHRSVTGYGLGLSLVDAIARTHDFTASLSQFTDAEGATWVRAQVSGALERAADA